MSSEQGAVRGQAGVPVLPVPTGWAGRQISVPFTASMVGLAVLALGMVAGLVSAARSGDSGAVALLAFGAVFLVLVVGFSVRSRRLRPGRGRPPTLVDDPHGGQGVRFGYATAPYVSLGGLLALAALVTTAVAVTAMFAGVVGVLLGVGLAALAVLLGWFLVTMLRLAPGELVLSPAGIRHRGLVHTQFVPWRDVYQVSAKRVNTPLLVVKANMSDGTRMRRLTGRFGTLESRLLPFVAVRPYWLAGDPVVVYHALAFYHSRPDLRPELGTVAAMERIAAGRTVATS
ncbi:hypothetical protein [Micromonospora mirobrigensis]|uniref:Bacterial PH domain n=1 Tax=Micromonospora mirobrigensis TaxID=262898 RepID=A0A1C4WMR7_9ACTN|nr:hypothetical protein [Micromonospora mirobrigensis]SCE97482.1 Bacterial PH domain [Micromonospora mirobrigensis]